jgi:peptidyl-prolyl cis-trans isomerase C
MKRIVLGILVIVLALVSCSGVSRQSTVEDHDIVRLFTAINQDVKYADTVFKGDDAKAVADLVKVECPQGVGEEFARVILEARSSTLTIYTSPDGEQVYCTILKPNEQRSIVLKSAAEAPDQDTALLVNGQPVTIAQIQSALAQLPNVANDTATLNQVVNRVVNDELLRQEAAKVEVGEDEVAKVRASVLQQSNLTEEQLRQQLAAQNVSMQQFEQSARAQAQLEKLLTERLLLDEISVSEEDARNYYLENPNQFLRSEQAVGRYIYISLAGRSAEEAQVRAQDVYDKINSTDFCALVKEYSDDPQSKDNCGVYVIAHGVINPNLENAFFSTPANMTSVVTTDAGVYFVQTLQVNPTQVVPYAQIGQHVQSGLRNMLFEQRLNLYLMTLRAQANITSYLG